MAEQIVPVASDRSISLGAASIAAIRDAHAQLLAAYVDAVRRSSLAASERQWYRRYSVRRFTEGHVKGRLDELTSVYAQLECTAGSDGDRALLQRAKADSRALAEPLARWRAPLALPLIPVFVGVIGQAIGNVSLYDPAMLYFGPLILVAAYGLISAGGWFDEKRSLFRECDVYRFENELFAQLGRGKSPEVPLNYVCDALAIIVGLVGTSAMIGDLYRFGPVIFAVLFAVILAIYVCLAQRALGAREHQSPGRGSRPHSPTPSGAQRTPGEDESA